MIMIAKYFSFSSDIFEIIKLKSQLYVSSILEVSIIKSRVFLNLLHLLYFLILFCLPSFHLHHKSHSFLFLLLRCRINSSFCPRALFFNIVDSILSMLLLSCIKVLLKSGDSWLPHCHLIVLHLSLLSIVSCCK